MLAALAPRIAHAQQSQPDAKFTDINLLGLMVNNNGFLGTNLPNGQSPPSFEYPLGTDLERMIAGGLWIGAINVDGDTLVSTGAIDAFFGSNNVNSEYTAGPRIIERSFLPNSRFFDPDNAVSEQDYVAIFNDLDIRSSQHVPLNVEVQLESYAWSFEPVNHIVFMSYNITNTSQRRLENVYVGLYAELLACNKNSAPNFPGGGVCFDRKHYQYDTPQRLWGNHFYDFNNTLVPGWGGFQVLGVTSPGGEQIEDLTISYDWEPFDQAGAPRRRDADRFLRMASGIIDPAITDNPMDQGTADPTATLSVGPFRFLEPDSTVQVVFAAVGGRDWADFKFRGGWAQSTYDSDYQIPLPPPSPGLFASPGANNVDLFWDAFPETIPDPVLEDSLDFQGYRLYVSRDNVDFTQVGEFDIADTIGFNTGFEAVKFDTIIDGHQYRYRYTVPSLKDGFEYFVAITSFDKGAPNQGVPPLESGITQNRRTIIPGPEKSTNPDTRAKTIVFPNPYRGEAVWDGEFDRDRLIYFANLPASATIRIFTLAGDLLDEIEFDADTYTGANAAAIFDPDFDPPALSGGLAAWDLLTDQDQTIASGLYIFSVEDHATGENEIGKFLVIR